jgi:hypothetical protein
LPEHVRTNLGQFIHVLLHLEGVGLHLGLDVSEPLNAPDHLLANHRHLANVSKSFRSSSRSWGTSSAHLVGRLRGTLYGFSGLPGHQMRRMDLFLPFDVVSKVLRSPCGAWIAMPRKPVRTDSGARYQDECRRSVRRPPLRGQACGTFVDLRPDPDPDPTGFNPRPPPDEDASCTTPGGRYPPPGCFSLFLLP